MKICIVGGTGNISSAVVKKLLELGHDVTLFNRGLTRPIPPGVRLIQGDRADRENFEAAIQKEHFDAGMDMICFTPEDAASDVRAFRGVGQFINTSTACTYGIKYDYFPSDETHPLRPISAYGRNKAAADALFMAAYYREDFPVTIIKPSTTYGPIHGILRQIAWEFSWIDRVRKGKSILICGDGNALHQHLHVDDAALAYCGVLANERCIGQTYNLVSRGYITWFDYHMLAMKVLGREVELVSIPFRDLQRMQIPNFGLCEEIFAHHLYYSSEKLFRDVPAFQPRVTLEEGMRQVFEVMDRERRVPNSDELHWEDEIISSWRQAHPGSN
jgi:nucleoside-diphosphate-sugar epimerase